jgi:hypothetical protein
MKKWNNFEIKLSNPTLITKDLLKINVNKFWNEKMSHLDDNYHVLLILRLKFENNQMITASTLKKIDKTNKIDIIEYLFDRISVSNEAYSSTLIKSIIFSYGIREGKIDHSINEISVSNIDTKFQLYYNNKLPIVNTGIPSEYGKILSENNDHYFINVSNKIFIVLKSLIINNQQVNKIKFIKNGREVNNWTDTVIGKNSIIREIGKSIYYYENKELILVKVIKKSKPIEKINVNKSLDSRIITMDLETILIDNVHVPYLLSWFDGNTTNSYFIESLDPVTIEFEILRMIKDAIEDICIRKYKNYKVYFHNFSKFDGYFLVKYLSKIGFCDPIIHKGRIISVSFNYNDINIVFKDSYLLLPSSLRKLGNSFKVDSPKGIFPYLLSDIDYIGDIPDFKYFSNISINDYNKYKDSFNNKTWIFRDEAIRYCELDCISLYQILSKFNTLIFDRFKLNINNYPTLPSLSFAIFRSQYLTDNSIHMLSGDIANDIRQGYTGGACDMYLPRPIKNKKIFSYDVNSLYPFVMANNKLPIKNPTYFSGDITKTDKNAFGFFYCNITSPVNLKHPILQTHIKTSEGLRTVAPLGSWSDMLFSEEMYNAMKFGYKFEVLWGYTFDSDYIFTNFVDELYQIRLDYPKSDPMNYIAKIIMNSLYGRFGMDDNFIFSLIMNKEDYDKYEDLDKDNSILDVIEIDDNYLVQTKNPKVELDTLLDNGSEVHNINIAIAAAITAYARIHTSQFKNNSEYNLYYTDTDSIYIDTPLGNQYIGKELGLMKLECICNDAVFLAPKVYSLVTDNGVIMKIKGLSNKALSKISFDDLIELLNQDSKLESKQEKWYKDISNGNIIIKDQIYTLKVTGNKRHLIYGNKLIYTKPIVITKEKEIKTSNLHLI